MGWDDGKGEGGRWSDGEMVTSLTRIEGTDLCRPAPSGALNRLLCETIQIFRD